MNKLFHNTLYLRLQPDQLHALHVESGRTLVEAPLLALRHDKGRRVPLATGKEALALRGQDGIELANGWSELTDATEQRSRFDNDNRIRHATGLPQVPLDERLLAALAHGLPDCAGVALGFDRLLMVAAGVADIGAVQAFCD